MAISSEIEKLERRWTENPSGLLFAPLAEAYRKAGDLQRAQEILEIGLSVHPDYVPALIVRGRCHLDSGELAEAEQALEQVLARDPANLIALRTMADVCERGGRVAEAVERLRLLLDLDHNNSGARADLDRLLTQVAPAEPTVGSAVAESADPIVVTVLPVAEEAPPAGDEVSEDLGIEKLSVDPMGEPEEAAQPVAELRLPWEPLPLTTWDEPAPPPSAPEPEPVSPPESVAFPEVAMEVVEGSGGSARLEADAPPLAESPVQQPAAVVWEEPAAVGEEEPAAVTGEEPAAVAEDPEAPADEEPVEAMGPGEVAPEPLPSDSPVMSHPVPPESPEASDLAWPGIEDAAVGAESGAEAEAPVTTATGEPSEEAPAGEETADQSPVVIVTESMAELFLKQGHRELALAVYRQLLERAPDDEALMEAAAAIEGELASREEARAEPDRSPRAASATGGTAVEDMLKAVLASPPPAARSTVLPPAIEPALAGDATRASSQPLTLGQVFGDEPSVPPPAVEAEPAAEPSFDEFFGTPAGAADVPAAAAGRTQDGDDMRQFTEWLKGLKR